MANSYSVSLKSKSIFEIIADADVVVQIVVVILLFASVWSWSIIISKVLHLRSISKKNQNFFKLFNSEAKLVDIFEAIKDNILTPIEYIFISSISELKKYNLDGEKRNATNVKARVHATMLHSKNKHINALENNLGHLATISTVAPFIGLFGTVWGIMRSFQAIAFSKNTSLAIVAPGIAEALFATALGLVAAIPALMFYNILLGKITVVENATDDFLVKLNSKIERDLKL